MTGEAGTPDAARTTAGSALEVDEDERLVLGDLLNRVLDKGVVISGHVTISVADIDLIAVDLRVLITAIQTAIERAGVAVSPLSRPVADADVPVLPPDVRR